MTIAELLGLRPKAPSREAVEQRPTRRAMYVHEMDEELVLALAAAKVDHLDSKPRRLAK